jgi:osmotically-inducible protein OsmY
MRGSRWIVACLSLALLLWAAGCSSQKANAPSYKDAVQTAMNNDNFKDVKVDEDRDKGVITLSGKVTSEDDKTKAEQDAKTAAPGLIIADQISVEPPGVESQAKGIEKDVDSAIKDNTKAAFIANHLDDQHIGIAVKNGVITLTGSVATPDMRTDAEKIAASVPNTQQVVNELKVKRGRATASR